MGFPTSLPGSLRAIAKAALPSLAAGLLASCISDGSNRTGGEYLGEHGVILQNPMYHVKVKGFPVADFWTTDAEPGHVNDTILLAGVKGPFAAEPRFSFLVSDTTLLTTLSQPDSTLRLSLSTPTWEGVGPWRDNGTPALVRMYDSNSVDSIRFRVLAWDLSDSGITSKEDWNVAVSLRNRRFLLLGDTLANLPDADAEDAIWLRVKKAYQDTAQFQARELPALKELLSQRHGRKHLVHVRLIPDTAGVPDSLSAMLRLGGQWAFQDAKRPSLLFGPRLRADSIAAKFRIAPVTLADGRSAVAYTLRYAGGAPGTMVVPMQRGLHVTLDRVRLLDSLEAGILRLGKVPPPRPAGSYSLAYFVPFATITLPIEHAELEADLPVQVRLRTSVDTLLGEGPGAITREDSLGLDSSITPWYTTQVGHPENIVNKVSISYAAVGDSLRRVIVGYSKDSILNDTAFLPIGGKTQLPALSGYGKNSSLNIQVEAGATRLIVRSYLSVRSVEEINTFRDSTTGETIKDLAALLPRFVNPGDDSIRLRATAGIQTLLNQADLGTDSRHEFEFRPYFRGYNDSAVTSTGTTIANEVVFPVLSTLQPRIESGALSVDLDIYLYPLKAR
jgi:hypothetical protein